MYGDDDRQIRCDREQSKHLLYRICCRQKNRHLYNGGHGDAAGKDQGADLFGIPKLQQSDTDADESCKADQFIYDIFRGDR